MIKRFDWKEISKKKTGSGGFHSRNVTSSFPVILGSGWGLAHPPSNQCVFLLLTGPLFEEESLPVQFLLLGSAGSEGVTVTHW